MASLFCLFRELQQYFPISSLQFKSWSWKVWSGAWWGPEGRLHSQGKLLPRQWAKQREFGEDSCVSYVGEILTSHGDAHGYKDSSPAICPLIY